MKRSDMLINIEVVLLNSEHITTANNACIDEVALAKELLDLMDNNMLKELQYMYDAIVSGTRINSEDLARISHTLKSYK